MNMYSPAKFIGGIDPDKELSLRIWHENFSDLETLVHEYGWVGQGFAQLIGNKHIRDILKRNGIEELTIDQDGVHGLENAPESERLVLKEVLTAQYRRSEGLVAAVKRDDFTHLDAVNGAVMKGLVVGMGVASALDVAGLNNTLTVMASRGLPGLLEASSVSHYVLEKEVKDRKGNLAQKSMSYAAEIGLDLALIAKRAPAALYEAINLGNWANKARKKVFPKKANESFERALGIKSNTLPTMTHLWSEAQESAPYRGMMGIASLGYLNGIVNGVVYKFLDFVTVFWVNSGNTIQGSVAVYSNISKNLPDAAASRWHKTKEAFKALYADPFQRANLIVTPLWFAGIFALHSYGFNLQAHFGNLGAALEASLIGVDTAVAAKFAKEGEHYNFTVAPYLSVSNPKLLYLAKEHGANELIRSLEHDYTPTGFMTYRGGQLTINTYQAIGAITEKVSKGAAAVGRFLDKTLS